MNQKILAVLLILAIGLGFSGVASAACQQVLVKEAWDEQVLVTPAYDEQVLVSEAYDEQVEVSPGYNETIHHPAVYKTVHHEAVYDTIHHPAVYEDVEVVDQEAYDEEVEVSPAYNETVVDQEAYNESIPADHTALTYKGQDYDAYTNSADQILKVPYVDKGKVKYENWNAQWFYEGYEAYGFRVIDDVGCGVNHIWEEIINIIEHPAITHIVEHPAVYDIIHHDAITHIEQVLVTPAWDEVILISEAWDEQVLDIPAWDEVIEHPPVFELVHHDAVYNIVNHPAVYDIIHHPAVYEDVCIPDEPQPPVDEPQVQGAVSQEGIPMQATGGAVVPLILGILAVLGGIVLGRRYL
jgi:hypothetical protein